jgi:hypothetical protein
MKSTRSALWCMKGELRVSARYMTWQPTRISHIQVIKSTMTILRSLSLDSESDSETPESWPVATKKVKNSAALGIRIFVESGLQERLIVKTTVRFPVHLVSFYMSREAPKNNKII